MAIILREITGTVRKPNGDVWANAQIVFELISSIVADADAEAVYPRRKQAIDCDENGLIPTSGNVPTVIAGYTYKLHLPDGAYGNFVAPTDSAAALSIDEVIALIAGGAAEETEGYTGIPLAQADLLLDLYDAAQDADAGEVAEADGAGKVVFNGRVGLPTADAAWVATGAAGGALGTAAYEDIADLPFDDEGAAAAVAGDLTTHEGLTGTAVHGLGSASTLTAGATGSNLVQAATVGAARAVLGLAPEPLEPRRLDHSALTYSNDLVGSGMANSAVGVYVGMNSGSTANSTARRFVDATRLFLGSSSNNSINWSVKNIFRCRFSLAISNAEGIFRWMVGKSNWSSYGIGDADYMVGFELANGTLTYALYGNNTIPTQLSVSGTGNNITIISENGAVSWYANGVLVAQIGSGGPTGDRPGTINYEIQNGPTAAPYRVYIWSQSECL